MNLINRRLIEQGVGYPAWLMFICPNHDDEEGDGTDICYEDGGSGIVAPMCMRTGCARGLDAVLYANLDDPQSAFGLALKLDEWERAAGSNNLQALNRVQWANRVAGWLTYGTDLATGDVFSDLIARLTQIGQDHAIRRALGEDPKPGTLASWGLMQPHDQWWRFDARMHGGAFVEWDRWGSFIGSAGVQGGTPNVMVLSGCERCVRSGGVCMRCRDTPHLSETLTNPAEALAAIYKEVCG